ncbi:multidrug efflux SMR transporter [Ammoniphilus sp. CFH 90114]|uniref:DMT family transporter n=1 Tax=Ammoniphilus sp. CFH 90114 TaxID=2493665 RepID=UPI00100DE599|nr:multidrug efflux SMR transporter [Ammoniphilus sp. CFH 90114]RXT15314.1 multidrug efflux SMR transporter [Ammoniphilus sp. CFH 90114]
MAWGYIFLAGILEIIWAFGLKFSNGFSSLLPTILTIVAIVLSFILFSKSLISIPIGTAYAVFTGIGAAGTVIIGMLLFNESVHFMRIFFVIVLLLGIIGLKITTNDVSDEENPTNVRSS